MQENMSAKEKENNSLLRKERHISLGLTHTRFEDVKRRLFDYNLGRCECCKRKKKIEEFCLFEKKLGEAEFKYGLICEFCDSKVFERKRKKINKYRLMRSVLFNACGGKCHYCEKMLEFNESTLDHVIPRSNGGLDRIDNLVLACQSCNCLKGSLSKDEFLKIRNIMSLGGKQLSAIRSIKMSSDLFDVSRYERYKIKAIRRLQIVSRNGPKELSNMLEELRR